MLLDLLVDFNRGCAANGVKGPWKVLFDCLALVNNRELDEASEALSTIEVTSPEMRIGRTLIEMRIATLNADLSKASDLLAQVETDRLRYQPDSELLQACCAHRMSIIERLRNKNTEAIRCGMLAQQLYSANGCELDEALSAADTALALINRGDLGAGIESLARASDVIERLGTPSQFTAIQANLSTAMQRSGDLIGAERIIRSLLDRSPFREPTPNRSSLLQNLAVICKQGSRYDEALAHYGEARALLNSELHKSQCARIENGMADVYYRIGDITRMKALCIGLLNTPAEVLNDNPTLATEMSLVRFRNFAIDGRLDQAYAHFAYGCAIAKEHRLWEEHDQLLTGALEFTVDGVQRQALLSELAEIRAQRLSSVSSMVTTVVEQRSRFEQERAAYTLARMQEQAQTVMETQERTIEAIGRDVHDSIGNDLAVAQWLVARIAQCTPTTDAELLNLTKQLQSLIGEASNNARRISHLIAAPGLDGSTLEATVADLLHAAQESLPNIAFSFAVRGNLESISVAFARTVYRCLQSLLQNIIKHANANAVEVQLAVHADELVCSVNDNGVGFEMKAGKGLGFRSIEARAATHGGNVRIDSTPGKGTYVAIHLPFVQPTNI